MSFFNADRARRLMARESLDALLATSPENVQYLSGHPGFHNRMTPNGLGAAAVIFADPSREPGGVFSNFEIGPARCIVSISDLRTYTSWIAIDRVEELSTGAPERKPVQPDPRQLYLEVGSIFRDRKVTQGRVGAEFRNLSVVAHRLLIESLPNIDWVPADELFSESRAVKSEPEIALLRQAALLTELGMKRAVAAGVRGVTEPELALRFQQAVIEAALESPQVGATRAIPININIGPQPFPIAGVDSYQGRDGDIVKLDCAVTVQGYHSDLGRTYVLGEPSATQARLARALLDGLHAGLEHLRPGRPLRDLYEVAVSTVRRAGYPRYARGHVGHAIGLAQREDAPFISAADPTVAEPGMTLAIELPYYVDGLGAFLFEDNLVITHDGYDLLNTTPVEFPRLSR